ncbi:unnamed protein product [Heligmosomoides polygyrus]|uniref:Uncharacterized protein n=1 Tax=Heligmosomoides polygyrus TaxID=6339 RepID=A0A183GH51_HELPZ|nr:unnamed protein product [Heligmosomoides polygyrus]
MGVAVSSLLSSGDLLAKLSSSRELSYSLVNDRVGCFARLGIYEENARFILISLLLALYLIFGAMLFHYVERENELEEREVAVIMLTSYRLKIEEITKRPHAQMPLR